MTRPLRWLLVALVAVAVVAPSVALRVWPAPGSDLTAAQLADRIRASKPDAWSGEVSTLGGLQVPSVGSFANVARLIGGSSSLRVWWHDDEHWRVDRTRGSGESDLMRNDGELVRWVYESRQATRQRYSDIRLPDESDLLPSTLAQRVLSGAKDSELSRLPARRIAGRSAAGLRLVPDDAQSTISRVDLWADRESGLPLQVVVHAKGNPVPVLTTEVTRLDTDRPSLADTRFGFPDGIRVRSAFAIDEAAGANAFAPFVLPDTLAGMARRGDPDTFRAVGIYGRSVTSVIAIPLRNGIARDLFQQLRKSKAAKLDDHGISLAVGPLSVRLTGSRRGVFLLAGTVKPAALVTAGDELLGNVRVTNR